jgi:hypothetical protein
MVCFVCQRCQSRRLLQLWYAAVLHILLSTRPTTAAPQGLEEARAALSREAAKVSPSPDNLLKMQFQALQAPHDTTTGGGIFPGP